MNKLELVQAVKDKCKLTEAEAAVVVDTFFSEISEALCRGERIEIRGLCSFFVKEYDAYVGRNPKTGKTVNVPPKRLPFFKCGKELKERANHA
ncbi:MAG: HU family DNA-binding protein [Pseudomonadota bacterium]